MLALQGGREVGDGDGDGDDAVERGKGNSEDGDSG